jgi:hypothetical protein
MVLDEPVKVYDAWNSLQAQFLHDLLADRGVSARVASDAIETLSGKIPFQKATCPVWVMAADLQRARVIVAEYEDRLAGRVSADAESARPYCYHCGQPVEAGRSSCPSCGLELDWAE